MCPVHRVSDAGAGAFRSRTGDLDQGANIEKGLSGLDVLRAMYLMCTKFSSPRIVRSNFVPRIIYDTASTFYSLGPRRQRGVIDLILIHV